ncbi:MAG TPA: rRNA maturation RNase YbeY [Patescibacteria group bacterium]
MENIIFIKYPKNWGLDEDIVRESAIKALNHWGYHEGVELSIFFVGRKKAKELNLNYRQMGYIPQVLGFPMSKDKDADGVIRLGDVVICTQKLKYETVFQKKSLKEVLDEWMVHGVHNLIK